MRRRSYQFAHFVTAMLSLSVVQFVGCGTTRSTDTGRTATEQLLISNAIDRAVQTVEFGSLRGQSVYLDDSRLGEVVDRNYLVSTLRQHLLASGCSLRDKKEDAEFVVEARAGAIGTDRNDLLFGVPSMNVPQILPGQPTPAAIPEIPIAKRRDQRGVAKIAVFAYHRPTGTPVWQSGLAHRESSSNDVWILGAGPFQRGTIYEGTAFAGQSLGNSQEAVDRLAESGPAVALGDQRVFTPPARFAASSQPAAGAKSTVGEPAEVNPHSPTTESSVVPAVATVPAGPVENEAYARLFARPPQPAMHDGRTAQLQGDRYSAPMVDQPSAAGMR
jgi:hypothetical protein